MNAENEAHFEEFLLGRLSTSAGRTEEARHERKGLFDVATLEPLDPKPGEPIRLRFRCGVDVSLRRLQVFWTIDGTPPAWNERLEPRNSTHTAAASPLPPVWDTLAWGYIQDWAVDLPAMADGALLQYAAIGIAPDGKSLPCPSPIRKRHASPEIAAVSIDRLQPPEWLSTAVIYQVFVDRFAPTPGHAFADTDDLNSRLGGTLWGLIDRLDDIASLGVNAIWLTPIFTSPNYHGYAVSDFFQVEPALGGKAAWEKFVEACRARGLRILLDFVANHVSDQHSAFASAIASKSSPTRHWFRFRRWPKTYDCFFDVSHQPELDGEQPAVREHLFKAAVYWLENGCDGYRLDYAHGLSHGFWSQFRAATRAAAPGSAAFGEITHTPQVIRSYEGRLDGCLDFVLCELLRGTFARGSLRLSQFDSQLTHHNEFFEDRLVLPSFLDNHDMNRFLVAAGGDVRRLKIAALVQFLLPNPPVIYYGTELGLSQNQPLGRLEEARLPMPPREQWDHELRAFYCELIRMRREIDPARGRLQLQWVDDDLRAAAWRIGNFELVVNLGEQRVHPLGEAQLRLATFKPDTSPPDAGHLTMPQWSAAVVCSPPGD